MSDDFGTVNVPRKERAREIEVMRHHFRRHREALVNMAADAPTEHLATEYRRLIRDLDASLHKLDDLEGTGPATPPLAPHPARSQPGIRPLATSAPRDHDGIDVSDLPPMEEAPRSRVAIIVVVAVIGLALIAWLIWRASSDRADDGAIVEDTAATATTTAPADTQPPAVPETLTVSPSVNDYGVIRKGTRATRQFEIANQTEEPISIAIARSTCRCLFYEHAEVVPPKGKESITVTVDGARAETGDLRETIRITSKSNPAVGTSFDVIATIR